MGFATLETSETEKRDFWLQKAENAELLGDDGDTEAYHRAVDYYQRAEKLRWDPAAIGYRIALIAAKLAERGKLAAAERYFDIGKRIAHDRVDDMCMVFGPYFVKGAVLSGDCDRAESYGQEFGLEPEKYYYLICETLIGEGKYSEALKWAQKYVEVRERTHGKIATFWQLHFLIRASMEELTGEDQLGMFCTGEIHIPAHVPRAKFEAWKRLFAWYIDWQRDFGDEQEEMDRSYSRTSVKIVLEDHL